MEFSPGDITLDNIMGGVLQAGEIPNARLETNLTAFADSLGAGGAIPIPRWRRSETSSANVGARTITGAWSSVVGITLPALLLNDRVFCWVGVVGTKGGVSDRLNLRLLQNGGTGVFTFHNDAVGAFQTSYCQASVLGYASMGVIINCTAAGNPVLELSAQSLSSNFTIPINDAQIVAWGMPAA